MDGRGKSTAFVAMISVLLVWSCSSGGSGEPAARVSEETQAAAVEVEIDLPAEVDPLGANIAVDVLSVPVEEVGEDLPDAASLPTIRAASREFDIRFDYTPSDCSLTGTWYIDDTVVLVNEGEPRDVSLVFHDESVEESYREAMGESSEYAPFDPQPWLTITHGEQAIAYEGWITAREPTDYIAFYMDSTDTPAPTVRPEEIERIPVDFVGIRVRFELPTGETRLQRLLSQISGVETGPMDGRDLNFDTWVAHADAEEPLVPDLMRIRLSAVDEAFYQITNSLWPDDGYREEISGAARSYGGVEEWGYAYFVRNPGTVTLFAAGSPLEDQYWTLTIMSNAPGGYERGGEVTEAQLLRAFSREEADAILSDIGGQWFSALYFALSGSREDFAGYNDATLRLLRNAVYARYGYPFRDEGLTALFSDYLWYIPRSDFQEDLHIPEEAKRQLETIVEIERARAADSTAE